ncbi:AraC family transcriptional regulator [Streptococcus varani]|uniref:AraC family transcriptional regulator n=1 Tax=Streptococcus varani TaxID=1608583 RepID=A0A0E4CS29_9STRE|nr:helix-turn-helix domain-containing protein [Streptococcus varani]CQR24164.1 AraC family transcriptional regulator [Streptococcus varani]
MAEAEFKRWSYDLCLILMQHFRVSRLSSGEENLADKLKSYVQSHFQEELTLSTMSADFYMTPQYFSKIFKEKMGETFYKYLTRIRLDYAKDLLDVSQRNVLQVSLESGFPNINALNRAFKEKFQILPSEYRKQIRTESQKRQQPSFQELSRLLKGQEEEKVSDKGQSLSIDTSQRKIVQPFWKKIINIGHFEQLDSQQVKEQLLSFQTHLSFEYIRLKLDTPVLPQENYGFYKEENIMDFFVKQGVKFQFVLDFRQVKQKEHALTFLKNFLSHFSNRYSIDKVRQWRFELDYMTVFDEDKCLRYGRSYAELTSILSSYKVEESLFGPGFVLGDVESLRLFQSMVSKGKVPRIQQLTFHVRQDVAYRSSNQIVIRKITDQQHVRNQLEMLSAFLDSDFHHIHIVEWKDYSPQQPWINDTSFKAANTISTTLACFDELADIAWNIPLDLLLDHHKGNILSGYEGCITIHGIAKPTFYAHHFLNRHGEDFLGKDDYSLVTASGHNITILTHNCSQLNYRYYLEEDSSEYEHADYFEKEESREFTYQLKEMKSGKYLIKTRVINAQSGSVKELVEQVFLDTTMNVGESEIDFLRKQAIPRLTVSKVAVEENSLGLSMTLEPNEIRHTHIIYLY